MCLAVNIKTNARFMQMRLSLQINCVKAKDISSCTPLCTTKNFLIKCVEYNRNTVEQLLNSGYKKLSYCIAKCRRYRRKGN